MKAVIENSPRSQKVQILKTQLQQVIEVSHQTINRHFRNEDRKGYSTIVCSLVYGNTAIIANVGNSRAYLYRKGKLQVLTEDYTLGNLLAKKGIDYPKGSKRDIVCHLLGQNSELLIGLYEQNLLIDDKLLLCSDGLWSVVDQSEIIEIISQSDSVEQVTSNLIKTANENRGLDNVSVVLCEIMEGEPEFEPILKRVDPPLHEGMVSTLKREIPLPEEKKRSEEVGDFVRRLSDLEEYFQFCVRLLTTRKEGKMIWEYDLDQPDVAIRLELMNKVKIGMANPKDTDLYKGLMHNVYMDEDEALQIVEINGLIALVFLGEKEAIPMLIAELRRENEVSPERRLGAGLSFRYLTGQKFGDDTLSDEDLNKWENWWEQNKDTFHPWLASHS
jgi:protein phosphatase